MRSTGFISLPALLCLFLLPWLFLQHAVCQDITRVEYYIDTDPGQGLAISVPFTSDSIISNLTFSPDISSLATGFHNLCIRTKDENNLWSQTAMRSFYKENLSPVLPEILRVEYFIDTDPGTGLATPVTITPGTNLSSITFPLDMTPLSPGFHTLVIRTGDANGKWSQAALRSFFRESTAAALANITRVEYFIDTDPGTGLATPVSITPGTNLSSVVFPLDMAPLSPGFHNLVIRTEDANGKWSQAAMRSFYREPLHQPAVPIIQAEYYIDSDPGQGMAIQVAITPGTNLSNLIFPVDISSLTPGFHNLCIRSKDEAGTWSELALRPFYKEILPVPPLPQVTRAEYYIDADPGFGSATDIPVTPSRNITNLSFVIGLGSMEFGKHTVSVRTKDANGIWSLSAQLEVKKYRVRAMLEGLYAGNGTMNQAMDENGPHFGADTADLVTVELHNSGNYASIKQSFPGMAMTTSGDIAFPAGPGLLTGSYYITIKHRNSIETTTASAISLSSAADSYDFTTAANRAYGSNQKNMGGTFAFWGGDVNQDGIVDAGDMNPVDNASTAITFGYILQDANGDGIVDLSDMNIVDNNATALIEMKTP